MNKFMFHRTYFCLTTVCATGLALHGQPAAAPTSPTNSAADPQRVALKVDRQESGAWREMNAATVFNTGDRVRFRVQANFSGYLYVMNHGTSGSYELLFPRSYTGSDNRLEAGKEYVVPAAQGWFGVGGPAGYDTVYWLLSPVELTHSYRPLPPPPATPQLPSTLRPRCDDTVFKARGECLDDSAGVKPVAPGEKLPQNLSGIAGATPRELLFMQEKGGVVMSSPQPLSVPVVYELRLAHH
jgi:hypothetical protein